MCGDPEVGEYPGRVTEVDWKRAVDCLQLRMHVVPWSNVFNLVLLLFVLAASCARWYVLLVVWHCWKGLSGLMAKPTSASVVSTPGKWNTVALLIHWHRCIRICPLEGAMVFESARAWECVSAK